MPNTPLLGIAQVATSQAAKEVTINDAVLALENATNAKLDVSFAAGASVLLSNGQAQRNFLYNCIGATAAATLRFPNVINSANLTRAFAVRNSGVYPLTVKFNTGAGSQVIIPPGTTRFIMAINALDMTVMATGQYPLGGFFFTAAPAANAVLFLHTFTDSCTLLDDFLGAVGKVGTNPTATFDMIVQINGANIGTISVSTGGVVTFTTTGGAILPAAGDVLKVVAPASPDATIANVSVTFRAGL